MKSRLYIVSAGILPGGRAVMACVDQKWYVHTGEYYGHDIFDGEDLREIACDMREIMYVCQGNGVFPDDAEVGEIIKNCISKGSFEGSGWEYIPALDGMTADEIRQFDHEMVMIGKEKAWYIMDSRNNIISQRFPEDETENGVFIPFNEFLAKKEFMSRFTREEADEKGYKLCLVLEINGEWDEIIAEYTPDDIYPKE